MKRLISLFLIVIICLSVVPGVSAARDTSYETALAQSLKSLGLFRGVSDTDFALDRAPTRIEALVMLIRVLGKESDAQSGRFRHPFTDVPDWADSYVGYAYQNNLSNGTSATTFGTENANAPMYLTFILRSLGYSDQDGKDFVWDNPYPLAEKIGILPKAVNRNQFLRADVVMVSYAALSAKIKGTDQSLADKLIQEKVFTKKDFNTYYDPAALENYTPSNQTLTPEEIYEKCSPAVFYIEVYDEAGYAQGSGSGFFLDSNGTAVTNYHVIENMSSAIITHSVTQQEYKVAGVYDYDAEHDWAILKVEGSGFDYLTIGDPATIVGGSSVYAIGCPLGLQNTISEGLISNTNRVLDGVTYIQTSAPISHGSSGGAFLNKYGEVIGITSAGFTDGENLGLAIPISVIEGYSTASITSLYDLFKGNNTSIPQNPSYLPEQNSYTAEQILAFFITEFYNETLNDSISYTVKKDYENGTIESSISLNADGELSAIVYSEYDTMNHYFSIDLNDSIDDKFVFYTYEDIYGDYLIAYNGIDARTVTQTSSLSLIKEEGTANYSDLQGIAEASMRSSLSFVNLVLTEVSSALNLSRSYSVADFGFTNF